MQALVYILIGTTLGWQITGTFIGGNRKSEEKINLIWVRLVSAFGVGILFETWFVYILGYFLSVHTGSENPLNKAEMLAMTGCIALFLCTLIPSILGHIKEDSSEKQTIGNWKMGLIVDTSLFKKEAVLYLGLLFFACFTFRYVLHADGDRLYIGYTVFSDYAPNLSLIRSFSRFENFPTQYPFYAGEDIKYHFMFMFLCGNLERMGMPLEMAYNLPSILGLFGFLVMFTQFAMRVTGKYKAAVITPFLFVFRSGLAFFYYIAEHLKAGDLVSALRENEVFIGYTPNENWGLWNYNVYLNQRHLGFGLLIVMAVIWYFYGYVEDANGQAGHTVSADRKKDRALAGFVELFLTKQAWEFCHPAKVLCTGLTLGLLSFWNGACVIGALLVLAGFAAFSRNKLDFLELAILAVSLSFLQTNFFIEGSAVSPTFYWGFISENKTLMGVLWFLIEISGMTIFGAGFAAIVLEGKYRALVFAFLLPVVFAFTISLTPDVTVNHKYIMMSMAFFSVIWAEMLIRLWEEHRIRAARLYAAVLAVILTATGAYDFSIIMRNNGKDHEFAVNTESNLGHYLRDNLTWDDMVLSGPDSVSDFTVSGCRMYSGWPYYAWSAGYDTDRRFELAKFIYSTDDAEALRETLHTEGITYVLFVNDLVYDGVYAREDVIASLFPLVYESDDGYYRLYHVD